MVIFCHLKVVLSDYTRKVRVLHLEGGYLYECRAVVKDQVLGFLLQSRKTRQRAAMRPPWSPAVIPSTSASPFVREFVAKQVSGPQL